MATEREMLDLLAARYNAERTGTIADRWVRAEHVRNSQQAGRVFIRTADFMALDKYASSQALHGHEVKVSRADWLTELRDPSKAEALKQFCDYWWLVVPDATVVKPGELPEDWGLLIQSGKQLRAKVKAPRLTPKPLTLDFIAGLATAVERTASRAPLHRDARSIRSWDALNGSHNRCQSCGQVSPCKLHQPRKASHGTD